MVEEAVHSVTLEGLSVSGETKSDMHDFVIGHVDSNELVSRTLSRYGVENA